jgi:hypothetical protein
LVKSIGDYAFRECTGNATYSISGNTLTFSDIEEEAVLAGDYTK